jgi:hypothetical protein
MTSDTLKVIKKGSFDSLCPYIEGAIERAIGFQKRLEEIEGLEKRLCVSMMTIAILPEVFPRGVFPTLGGGWECGEG